MIALLAGITLVLVPQGNAPTPAVGGAGGRPASGVQFDQRGWPVVPGGVELTPRVPDPAPARSGPAPAPAGETAPATLSLDSPLRDVFATVRTPAAFRALGGVVVWWRVHLYGLQGETVGMLEITQVADLGAPDRDRLEYPDERVYGRSGATVAVHRHGMPWPSLEQEARQELDLFGVLLRMPWEFGDARRYTVQRAEVVEREGVEWMRVPVLRLGAEQRQQEFGPAVDPRPADRFELWCDPASMLPRELVYRLASSGSERRILLEDWREFGGVRMPWRRICVDGEGRRTAAFELLRLEPHSDVTDRLLLGR